MRPLALVLLLLPACGSAGGEKRPDVILICLDTVRADRLGCYGYRANETTPRLDALANESTLFVDASASACWTKPSVPSFLTGTYPLEHGVYEGSAHDEGGERSDVLPEAATTLAEMFRDAGWSTAAFVRNAQLRRGLGFEQGFELYQDEAGDAREIRWRAQDWLDARAGNRPFFLYLHFLDAHWPWPVPEEYATRFAPAEAIAPFRGKGSRPLRDAVNAGERVLGQVEREAMGALYDGSLRYIDDQLSELFAWLERRGRWRDTVVCVIADHGEEFGEHGKLGHGHGLYEGLLRVPWILRVPGRPARRVEAPVSLIDLFPTLLSAAGLAPPGPVEGIDRLAQPDARRAVFAEHKEPDAYQQSLRSGTDKLVRRFTAAGGAGAQPGDPLPRIGRRYDVDLDPSGGRLRALAVAAGEDDPADPPELKGTVQGLRGTSFSLCGVPVRLAADAVFYGELQEEGAGAEELREGRLVKIVATPQDAFLEAKRVKLYAGDAEPELELRGSLEAFEGDAAAGRLRIAGLWVVVDGSTRWTGVEGGNEDGLARETVLGWLQEDALPDAAFRLERRLFDLSRGPGESEPRTDGPPLAALDRALDELGERLARRRIWSEADQRLLDSKALDELRALGYVR